MEGSFSGILNYNNTLQSENKNNSTSYNDGIDISQNDIVRDFKVVLIGSPSVGKTCIFHKFITGKFTPNYKPTLNVEYRTKYMKIDKNLYVKLIVWDTCGSEKFRAVTKQYYKGAHAIVLVFDLTVQKTFNDLKNIWLKDVNNYAEKNIEILIVGNKSDLIEERKADESQVINFCRDNGYKYIETSAKEGTNILKIFEELSLDLTLSYKKEMKEQMNREFLINNFEDKSIIITKNKKFGCC